MAATAGMVSSVVYTAFKRSMMVEKSKSVGCRVVEKSIAELRRELPILEDEIDGFFSMDTKIVNQAEFVARKECIAECIGSMSAKLRDISEFIWRSELPHRIVRNPNAEPMPKNIGEVSLKQATDQLGVYCTDTSLCDLVTSTNSVENASTIHQA